MQYSETVRWPQSWRSPVQRRHYVSFAAVFMVFVLAPLAIGVHQYSTGRIDAARYCFVFATVFAFVSWTGFHIRIRYRHSGDKALSISHTSGAKAGIQVPYSGKIFAGLAAITISMAALFCMAALDFSQSDDDSSAGGVAVSGALALFFASLPLLMATGRFARGHLTVSPDGIYQRGWTFSSYLPWSDIRAVHPYYANGPQILLMANDDTPWERKQILKLWKADRLPNIPRDHGQGTKPVIIIPGQSLAVDPALVLHLLTFYAKHPEARSELGTDAALRRARTGTFT